MSQWLDDQAEESEHEEEDAPVSKRPRIASDDEDDEEEDESKIAEEMRGFVVTGDEEDDEGDGNEDEEERKSESEEEEDLLEDDEDLIQENLGISLKKRKRRVQVGSDSEEENEKNDLEKQLFEGGEEDEGEDENHISSAHRRDMRDNHVADEEGSVESAEESGVDDFIEDDENETGRFRGKQKKKRRSNAMPISDSALQEAREIFGDAIDLEDLYGEEDEEEEVEEAEGDEYEEDEQAVERRVKRVPKKKRSTKKTLLDNLEPSELDRGYLSEVDKKIQLEDKPERFQLRGILVTEADSNELLNESQWIFNQLYRTQPVSHQETIDKHPGNVIPKINETLNFVRNQDFEVPFIAFYRKEYVDTTDPTDKKTRHGLNLPDLWKIFDADEKWCQMRNRMKNLHALFTRMQKFQYEFILQDPSKPLTDDVRILTEDDMTHIWQVETPESLQDVYLHFLLYYGRDVPKMVEWERVQQAREEGNEEEQMRPLKQAIRRDKYSICVDAGLCGLANHFGLTPKKLAENVQAHYAVNKIEHCPISPTDAAQEFLSDQFDNEELVLKGAAYIVGIQFSREPLIRKIVRDRFRKWCTITVRPTIKGLKELDENHQLYGMRYLKNKPIKDLERDHFLQILQGESMGLLKMTMSIDSPDSSMATRNLSLYETWTQNHIYHSDEYREPAAQWDKWRDEALKICIDTLHNYFAKETKTKLIQEAKKFILNLSAQTLVQWLKIAPYTLEEQTSAETDEDPTKYRVLGIAYSQDRNQASFCALVDGEGEVTDHLRLVHLTKRKNAYRKEESLLKMQDLETLRQFVINKRPQVIVIGGESMDSIMIKQDIVELLQEMEASGELSRALDVEIIDNDLAKVYMNSHKAQDDFPDYPILLRQAISVARRLQDPLLEFCQMCTPDDDVLCLKYHPSQDLVTKEELWAALQIEFINRVNEVGVDVNRCLEHPHTASVLQFVCGLGPRKAAYLLKVLHQNDNLLENRTKLVTLCHMGPKVFMNCAGFIKIDTTKVVEKTDAYVEVLDGTRIHPETYEWARKMAVDALEYDDTGDDANPAGALEEILETPERLKDLDLDAFADELQRQGFGNKNITLYDIRAELTYRYKDMRQKYKALTNEELFPILTKETDLTLKPGKLVLGRITNIVYRKPREDEGERILEPRRNEETGMWQCTACQRSDFSELSEVWSHVDMKLCPGQAIGVRLKLENGLSGFISNENLSDKLVTHPGDRVKIGMPLYCRIIRINPQRFGVDLSCRSSVLKDEGGAFKPPLDQYFDYDSERSDARREKSSLEKKQKQQYVKRVIAHPAFHNCSFKDAETILECRDQGEVIIRPSSKGEDHLTVTWKVTDDVYQHIDVLELQKDNAFSLGRTLQIGDDTFEDLDEIIARHIEPMASYAREIIAYKYYRVIQEDTGRKRDEVERLLLEEKRMNAARISYMFTASKELPGKFMLSYLPRTKARHEFVTVMPNGLRFRGLIHRSLNQLLAWFKEHFRDPIPGMTPLTATPLDHHSLPKDDASYVSWMRHVPTAPAANNYRGVGHLLRY